ncbi:NAD-dependent epimerase/dehydratase family protein [Pinibacter aurantiacus]|uniref:Galactowaldenase n=1 Tax=Pinibacter aurantiacus TaxID=2851599 RepID=A0A9E2W2X6_9BACT|nr:SDR family oxidoreductase [Pinibacter aurantiacus]MBV4357840.1 SDR family oxidoreductase [Pinibacter aurantiacus]
MKILVLGSQGFIGSHLVASFIDGGHTVTGCDLIEASVSKYRYQKMSILSADFDTLFSDGKFDVCVNASGSGNVAYSMSHPIFDFEANTYAVAKVLDTIRKHQPLCKYVHISSAAVYGNPNQLPIKEDDILSPVSAYGYHKVMSEQICKEYSNLYNIPVAIIRPFSVYGKGLRKQLLWDVCTKLAAADGIKLWGTGNESRDFIHINDMVALINIIIEKCNFKCNVYNAATGTETTIREVADIFEKYYNGSKTIGFSGEEKKGDPINWRASVDNAIALGFAPKITMENAVTDYISWYHQLTNEQ